MSRVRLMRNVFFLAMTASRSPAVRAALRNAPRMMSAQQKAAAYQNARKFARKAGETAGRIVPDKKS